MDRAPGLTLPLTTSILVHLAILVLLSTSSLRPASPSLPFSIELRDPAPPRPAPPEPSALPPVESVPQAAPPESQIVAPPDSPEAEPEIARYRSERSHRAEEETIRRGVPPRPAPEPANGPVEPSTAEPPERAQEPTERSLAEERPREERPLPGLSELFARPSEALEDPALRGDPKEKRPSEEPREDHAAIARPELWLGPGEVGVPDYLPSVRAGRFTLLNTKADLFAPFVRRVGLRVFQSFSNEFRNRILTGAIHSGKEIVEVEAIMDGDGRRLEVALRRRSGNLASDRVLLGALGDRIFFDENPPDGAAASDGRIHFVFSVDASVWRTADAQTGRSSPAAQWLFGAGLL